MRLGFGGLIFPQKRMHGQGGCGLGWDAGPPKDYS